MIDVSSSSDDSETSDCKSVLSDWYDGQCMVVGALYNSQTS
jgi:hypothetical protein